MIVTASITGLFKTLLLIAGAFVVIRFFGKLMVAKRNIELQQQLKRKEEAIAKEKEKVRKSFGKTRIVSSKEKDNSNTIEDVDFEELD